jgi:hypothetical protein
MIYLHTALYAFSLSIGFIMGILFPQLPWVTLWLLVTPAVLAYRLHTRRQQRQLQAIIDIAAKDSGYDPKASFTSNIEAAADILYGDRT